MPPTAANSRPTAGTSPKPSYRCGSAAGVANELSRRVYCQDQAQKDDAETESQSEITPAGLQRDGGGHCAGDARYVAADDQDRPDLGSGSSHSSQYRRNEAEPTEPQQRADGVHPACAVQDVKIAVFAPEVFDHLPGNRPR